LIVAVIGAGVEPLVGETVSHPPPELVPADAVKFAATPPLEI
jgi:hypothetical protein